MPTAVFDMIGTLFRLDRLKEAFEERGVPGAGVDLWLASSLRDYMAISYAGGFIPLGRVLAARLPSVFDAYGHEATDEVAAAVMGRFGELKPDPGAAEGCEALAGAGWRMLVLTNGSESLARTLLSRSGLDRHMSAVLSCESISVAKPHWRVYEYGATHAHGQPWMVASHPWDLYGAAQAGMRTALVGSAIPPLFPAPDAAGADIAGAARAMIEASGP